MLKSKEWEDESIYLIFSVLFSTKVFFSQDYLYLNYSVFRNRSNHSTQFCRGQGIYNYVPGATYRRYDGLHCLPGSHWVVRRDYQIYAQFDEKVLSKACILNELTHEWTFLIWMCIISSLTLGLKPEFRLRNLWCDHEFNSCHSLFKVWSLFFLKSLSYDDDSSGATAGVRGREGEQTSLF